MGEHNPLELDKWRSPLFDQIADQARATAHARRLHRKATRITLMDRLFGRRQYRFTADSGVVVGHHSGHFAFRGGARDYPIIARPGQMPPPGQQVTLACGEVVWRGGKAVSKPKPVLLGFALPDGKVVKTKGRWARLHGGAWWIALLIVGLICALPFLPMLPGQDNTWTGFFSAIFVTLGGWLVVFALLIRPYQIFRDSRAFHRNVDELKQLRTYG